MTTQTSTATHKLSCRAHAIGCAVENLRDGDPKWADMNPVALGDDYLADGTATCYCDTDNMAWAASWIALGIKALDEHGTGWRDTAPMTHALGRVLDAERASDGIFQQEIDNAAAAVAAHRERERTMRRTFNAAAQAEPDAPATAALYLTVLAQARRVHAANARLTILQATADEWAALAAVEAAEAEATRMETMPAL